MGTELLGGRAKRETARLRGRGLSGTGAKREWANRERGKCTFASTRAGGGVQWPSAASDASSDQESTLISISHLALSHLALSGLVGPFPLGPLPLRPFPDRPFPTSLRSRCRPLLLATGPV